MFVWQIPNETKKKRPQKSKTEEAKKSGKKGDTIASTSKNQNIELDRNKAHLRAW